MCALFVLQGKERSMTEKSLGFVEGEVGYSEALATWTTRYLDPT